MIAISTLVILYVLINFRRHIHNKLLIPTLLVFCYVSSAFCDEQKYLGVASCSSSNCHGSVKSPNSSNVLQNEYVTWQRHDSHSKAWSVLTNNDSKIIGKHLGITNPEKDKLCLSCHSTVAKNTGDKFNIEDGVSCESCHGAASNWIKSHTVKNATHDDNLKNEMYDLASSENRATKCLSCHLGSNESQVSHKLIGAGHPRLTFELETFSEIMPRHWNLDNDYTERKSPDSPSQIWLVGQIERAKKMLELLTHSIDEKLIPDFTFFNCYSCHHSLKEDQWKTHDYHGSPGKLNINTASLTLVSLALDQQDLKNKITEIQNAEKREELKIIAKELISILETLKTQQINTNQAISRIKKYALENPYPQYELAEQIIMAINVLSGKNSKEFKEIYKSLEDEEAFNSARFTEALKKLR